MDLRYATKLSERTANGNDGGDYVEETYEANQFHGQDGIGRAIFGYTDNQQSRLEARNVNGEVRGKRKYSLEIDNFVQISRDSHHKFPSIKVNINTSIRGEMTSKSSIGPTIWASIRPIIIHLTINSQSLKHQK